MAAPNFANHFADYATNHVIDAALMPDANEHKDIAEVVRDHLGVKLVDDIELVEQVQILTEEEFERGITKYYIGWRILPIHCNPKAFNTREEAENEIKQSKWYKRLFMCVEQVTKYY